jgi:hypothetical protein
VAERPKRILVAFFVLPRAGASEHVAACVDALAEAEPALSCETLVNLGNDTAVPMTTQTRPGTWDAASMSALNTTSERGWGPGACMSVCWQACRLASQAQCVEFQHPLTQQHAALGRSLHLLSG